MAARYLVTGVQFGLLKSCLQGFLSKEEGNQLINEILEDQFVGNSNNEIKDDVKFLSDNWEIE